LGNITRSTFDPLGNQLSAIDPLGNATFAKYDDNSNQIEHQDAEGHVVKYTYNNEKKLYKTLTDAKGNTFELFYDDSNNLIAVKDPAGNRTELTFNSKGLVTSKTDALKRKTSFKYDSAGNLIEETDALGNTVTYTYDQNHNELSHTTTRTVAGEPVIDTTHYKYDSSNRLTQMTDALGNVIQTEYNTLGQVKARVDELGRRTTFEYDIYGNPTQTTYPDGSKVTRRYDAEGNLLSMTDTAGHTTTYQYDALDRKIFVLYPNGQTSKTSYDAASRVIAQVDEAGHRSTYSYNKIGQPTTITNALGNTTQSAYDANGNLATQTDTNGNVTTYVYDNLDRQVKIIFADKSEQISVYDVVGNQIANQDQTGVTTQYRYDASDRLIEVIDALGQKTHYSYDEKGNQLSQTDANSHTTRWQYDALGRLRSRTLPLNQSESFTYDKVGNLKSHKSFNGDFTFFSYNPKNSQLVGITYPNNDKETFTYDTLGNRLTVTDKRGTTRYQYDSFSRLIKETQPNGAVLEYSYDARGNRTEVKVTLGDLTQIARYDYDNLNRLIHVTNGSHKTTYSYDKLGNRNQVSYPNGTATTYQYDKLNRLIEKQTVDASGKTLVGYQYTLSPSHQRLEVTEQSGRKVAYAYDKLSRLLSETITDSANGNLQNRYEYDPVGNRTYSVENGVHTAYSYDANDRLIKAGGETYGYDDNGNLIQVQQDQKILSSANYDANNRLTQATITPSGSSTSTTVSYAYDADGHRVLKEKDGQQTTYVVDTQSNYAQVIAEVSDDSIINYVYGDDLISQTNPEGTVYYHSDALGSTRALTDNNGTVTDTYYYSAYGQLLNRTGTTTNAYLFTGEQYDDTLGSYYLRARYYNPALARFLSMDSFDGLQREPLTLNKYLYANGNPANMIDPSGQFSIGSLSAAISIRGMLTAMRWAGGGLTAYDFITDPTAFLTEALTDRLLRLLKLRRLQRLFSKLGQICQLGKNSFTANTLVHTQRGLITIASVRIGDQVWSYNEETGEPGWNEVVHLIQSEQEYDLVLLTLENGEIIEATKEHPFSVVDKGWVAAENLTQGDVLVTKDGNVEISSVVREQRTVVVYNLTVENARTFYISRDGVLVHNNIPTGNPTPDLCKLGEWINPSFKKTTPNIPIYKGAPLRLPTRKDVSGRTAIIFEADGINLELLSGERGPAQIFDDEKYSGWKKHMGLLRYHVETHVAAFLRIVGQTSGTMHINHYPCGYDNNQFGCYINLGPLLPLGTNVKVYFPYKGKVIEWDVSGSGPPNLK